jgi:sirohydrochlorin cobaltochelatase
VIPRELELDGAITHRPDGKVLKYCDPVGLHLSMTELLKARALETAPDLDPRQTSLLLVGHGTRLNEKSREAVEAQVEKFRGETEYAQVIDTYMEEEPLITNWREIADQRNVVVVPFFISDGLHSYQDIPVMLGIEKEPTEAASRREVFRQNPREMDGRELYYSAAIGSHPQMVDVILDQVRHFDADHPEFAEVRTAGV